MSQGFDSTDRLCVNAIRTLSIDMIQKANSGHPGLPMGAAPMAYVLWSRHLRHNPEDPSWPDRDRFVLSAGHGSALLYSLMHLAGYDLTMEDLENFRQWGSRTPGHPEAFQTPGVEATTGPLGQGSANAVGMAIAERFLAGRYNRPEGEIVDHFTYALVTDGDLMEGISAEAGSLAGHLKSGKLIYLYDSNDISLDGPTSLAFSTEDVLKRYQAYGWQTLRVEDGDTDLEAIDRALNEAKSEVSRPTIIEVKTTIGYGSPNRQGTSGSHGSPLGDDEVRLSKENLGWEWPEKTFSVPVEVYARFGDAAEKGKKLQSGCHEVFVKWSAENPGLATEWKLAWDNGLPEGWDKDIPVWEPGKSIATRAASGKVLNSISDAIPWLLTGDADLSCSTKVVINDGGSFDGVTGEGRNVHMGVREHVMAAIANGIAYHGGCRMCTSTFFVFSDYMKPAVRLAAMDGLPVIYAWTHDSVYVGEDGPTHQPVEHLAALRVIPNLVVIRPSDAAEVAEAWRWTLKQKGRPVALVLTRQGVPVIDRKEFAAASGLEKGAYILKNTPDEPDGIIIATGSEVSVALEASDKLADEGIHVRVVSMPSWEIFSQQDEAYREKVLSSNVKARVSVEAGVTMGWERWIGDGGIAVGINRFGASAPGKTVAEKLGMTSEKVVEAVRSILKSRV